MDACTRSISRACWHRVGLKAIFGSLPLPTPTRIFSNKKDFTHDRDCDIDPRGLLLLRTAVPPISMCEALLRGRTSHEHKLTKL